MWVLVNDQDRMRSPSEFRFAVAEEEVLVQPLVRCVDDAGESGLTKGKLYYLKRTEEDGLIVVVNDQDYEAAYLSYRFEMD